MQFFGQVSIAPDDAKSSISQQLKTLENNYRMGLLEFGDAKISTEAAYVEASRIRNDVQQYIPWEASWAPLSTGGWNSSSDIVSRLDKVFKKIADTGYKPAPAALRVSATTPSRIECNEECQKKEKCKHAAEAMFGPAAMIIPGAEQLACDWEKYKTRLYIAAAIASVLLVIGAIGGAAVIFRPYASIASVALSKRPKRRKSKRRK